MKGAPTCHISLADTGEISKSQNRMEVTCRGSIDMSSPDGPGNCPEESPHQRQERRGRAQVTATRVGVDHKLLDHDSGALAHTVFQSVERAR
jgi:hypothetical protein